MNDAMHFCGIQNGVIYDVPKIEYITFFSVIFCVFSIGKQKCLA